MKKRLLSLLVALCMAVTLLPVSAITAWAEDPPKSGKCGAAGDGSGVTWQLTENTDDPSTYTLTISGSGAMEDYLMSSNQPWCSFRKHPSGSKQYCMFCHHKGKGNDCKWNLL